jgi:hypothetical protein
MTAGRPAPRFHRVAALRRAADRAGRLRIPVLLVLGLIAGCDGSSSSSTAPLPVNTGALRLVAPIGCAGVPCADIALQNTLVMGPVSPAPFTLTFGSTSTLPFAPAGTYTVTGGTFQSSTNETRGCPTVNVTVASGKTTTVTFAITNDVCSATVSGPA